MKSSLFALSTAVLLVGATTLSAGEVTMEGVHLCCGGCVSAVNKAISDVDGISGVAVDRADGKVTFTASDEDSAKAAVKALAKAGFAGKAKMGDETIAMPETGAKKDAKGDKLTFKGVHICCPACVRDIRDAVSDVKGMSEVEIDRNAGTVTLIGSDISQEEAAKALTENGFYGKLEG